MNKLKSKVFWVIFIILSVFSIAIIGVSNVQSYRQEYHETASKFENVSEKRTPDDDGKNPPPQNDLPDSSIRFADAVVYTVVLGDGNSILEISNHTNNSVTDTEIKQVAQDILSSGNSGTNVGNLYFQKYSYCLKDNLSLTIIDNSTTNSKLLRQLILSLAMLLGIEIIILFISKRLTVWIIKPVRESFEKQKQFIADASHELKTPLAVIMASSDALEAEPQEQKWLANIKSESEKMNKLITSLLDLAQSDDYTDKLELEECNLSKLTESSVLPFEGIMFEKSLALDYDIDDDIKIKADSEKIKQLIGIIIDNAISHSRKNEQVFVSLKKAEKTATLEITNTGDPIATGDEEKIFERFYRGDKSRNRDDNRYGLGLAIAKNIVTAHGGKISARSNGDKTTFKIVFNTI